MQFQLNPSMWLLYLATIAGLATAVEPYVVETVGSSPHPLDFLTPGPAPSPSSGQVATMSYATTATAPLPSAPSLPGAIAGLLPVPPAPPPGAIVNDPTAPQGSDQPPMPTGEPINRAAWEPISKTVGPDGCLTTPIQTTRPEGRSMVPADWDPNLQFVILVEQGFLTCIEYTFTEG